MNYNRNCYNSGDPPSNGAAPNPGNQQPFNGPLIPGNQQPFNGPLIPGNQQPFNGPLIPGNQQPFNGPLIPGNQQPFNGPLIPGNQQPFNGPLIPGNRAGINGPPPANGQDLATFFDSLQPEQQEQLRQVMLRGGRQPEQGYTRTFAADNNDGFAYQQQSGPGNFGASSHAGVGFSQQQQSYGRYPNNEQPIPGNNFGNIFPPTTSRGDDGGFDQRTGPGNDSSNFASSSRGEGRRYIPQPSQQYTMPWNENRASTDREGGYGNRRDVTPANARVNASEDGGGYDQQESLANALYGLWGPPLSGRNVFEFGQQPIPGNSRGNRQNAFSSNSRVNVPPRNTNTRENEDDSNGGRRLNQSIPYFHTHEYEDECNARREFNQSAPGNRQIVQPNRGRSEAVPSRRSTSRGRYGGRGQNAPDTRRYEFSRSDQNVFVPRGPSDEYDNALVNGTPAGTQRVQCATPRAKVKMMILNKDMFVAAMNDNTSPRINVGSIEQFLKDNKSDVCFTLDSKTGVLDPYCLNRPWRNLLEQCQSITILGLINGKLLNAVLHEDGPGDATDSLHVSPTNVLEMNIADMCNLIPRTTSFLTLDSSKFNHANMIAAIHALNQTSPGKAAFQRLLLVAEQFPMVQEFGRCLQSLEAMSTDDACVTLLSTSSANDHCIASATANRFSRAHIYRRNQTDAYDMYISHRQRRVFLVGFKRV